MPDSKMLGLRTTIYKVANLEKAKAWYCNSIMPPPTANMGRSIGPWMFRYSWVLVLD
jgi:hypothetical protein